MATFVFKCLNPLKEVRTSNLCALSIWARSNKAKSDKREKLLKTRELPESLNIKTLFLANGHPVGFLRARRQQLVSDLGVLHAHVREGRVEAALGLLEEGADGNAIHSGTGDTPMHIAVENSDVAMVHMLLEFDLDLTIENDKGLTAFRIAEVKWGEAEENGCDEDCDVYRVFWALFSSYKINF